MERIERRDEGSIGVDPDEVPHPALGNQPSDLVGGVPVRINKKTAVALADVLDEKVDEQCGLSHAAHSLQINVLRGVDEDFTTGDTVGADGYVHALSAGPESPGERAEVQFGSAPRPILAERERTPMPPSPPPSKT